MKKSKQIKPIFLGYVIASHREDFFFESVNNAACQLVGWHLFPDMAKRFSTAKEAVAVIDLMKFNYPVFVLEIYEIGKKKVALREVDDMPVPDWL